VQPVARRPAAASPAHPHDSTGVPLAELVDDRVEFTDGAGSSVGAFREIELEERPACSPEIVKAISDALMSAGAKRGEFLPKLAQALGTTAQAPP
jgi:hypothetical protein